MGKEIKAGDIMLFSGGHWISRIIQWGTKSKYNHVAVSVDPDISLMIEAAGRVRAEDTRRAEGYDIYRVRPEYSYDLDKVISYLVDKLNRPYDYLGVAYLGILKVLGLKTRANKWQKDHDYFCSELAKSAFLDGGLDIVPGTDAGNVSPGDIANSPVVEKIP